MAASPLTQPAAAKAALRSRVLAARADLPVVQRAAACVALHRRLLGLEELARARAVLAYAAFGAEADLDPVLRVLLERGAGVLLPWVDGPTLGIARIRDLDADLAPGWRGVREPRVSGRHPARPDRVDVALVPLVAFDAEGHRLGYGGGHFDRLLARLAPGVPRIGVAFAVQQIASVPAEVHDVPLDMVVTEAGITRPARPV
ncbi:5-formyltetrahydrofolate cyclo-ligase [soil metagenome]